MFFLKSDFDLKYFVLSATLFRKIQSLAKTHSLILHLLKGFNNYIQLKDADDSTVNNTNKNN